MEFVSDGVYGGGGRPGGPAAIPTSTGATSWANRSFGVTVTGDIQGSPQGVNVGGSFGVSGLLTLVAMVGALFLVDRYVVDVPGVGK